MLKEKLYTIPVNDAFGEECECAICFMRKTLEENAIEFTMGPSYMEDDVRVVTSQLGFCNTHAKTLYDHQNRLGLALVLKSHLDQNIKDVEKLTKNNKKVSSGSIFKRKDNSEELEIVSYINKLNDSCYICDKVDGTFMRYIATIFYLYKTDEDFKKRFKASKGFCAKHYGVLYAEASKHMSGELLNDFIKVLNQLYLDNIKRVRDDLEWFISKFDYRFVDEPWKNSKDAIPRTLTKTNNIL